MSFRIENRTKIITLGSSEIFQISSDHHFPPDSNTQELLPLITPPNTILNGDFVHGYPIGSQGLIKLQRLLSNLANEIAGNGITGDDLTIHRGNHLPMGLIPDEVRDFLINEGIMPPADRTIIQFPNGVNALVRHGHNLKGESDINKPSNRFRILLDKFLNKLWNNSRPLIGIGEFPIDQPASRAIRRVLNFRLPIEEDGVNLLIEGHTHFPEIRRGEVLRANSGLREVYLMTELQLASHLLSLNLRNLNTGEDTTIDEVPLPYRPETNIPIPLTARLGRMLGGVLRGRVNNPVTQEVRYK